MVETFTPAVCGSRTRQRLAIVLFTAGAVLASAGLGAVLGFAGSLVGTRPALIAAAALALLAAPREAGVPRPAGPAVAQTGAGALAIRASHAALEHGVRRRARHGLPHLPTCGDLLGR